MTTWIATLRRRLACALYRALALAPGPAVALALAFWAAPAGARGLDDWQHTVWTTENGAPAGIVTFAQTREGWLWFGTDDGLFRFDGVSFERYVPGGQPGMAHMRVIDLHAAGNGDLYVSLFPGEVGVLHREGRFELLPHPAQPRLGTPNAMAVDSDGTLWTADVDGVQRFAHGQWTTVASGPAWSRSETYSMLLDQNGRLWVSGAAGTLRLDRVSGRFDMVRAESGSLALAPDGGVWLIADDAHPALRLAASADGSPRPANANAIESRHNGQFDAAGTLWALNCPDMVCLVRDGAGRGSVAAHAADDRLPAPDGAADRDDHAMLEDREGNVWIAGRGMLHRFRPKRFLAPHLNRSGTYYTVAADGDGQVWAAEIDSGKLWRLQPDGSTAAEPGPGAQYVATGRDGALLMGGPRSLRRRLHGATEEIPLPPGPDGKPVDRHMLGVLDDGKVLWTATLETGAIGWDGRTWQPGRAFGLPQQIYMIAAGAPGELWMAVAHHDLVRYEAGKLTHHDASAIGTVTGIFPGAVLCIGGADGFAILKDGKLQRLRSADPDALRGISGVAVTHDGDRWLNGAAGVLHVRAADWQRAMDHPDQALRHETFGAFDGYPGRAGIATRLPSAVSDGRRVWFVGTGGIVGLDSANLRRNAVAPQSIVLDVVTAAGSYGAGPDPRQPLRLPPGSDSFRVHFTAPALRQPERVRFQYRLDGVDARWEDAGTRRMTSYTNVGPGDYAFHVRALNEDGVPSPAAATLRLTIAPTFVQSLPFKLAAAAALAALALLLHRLRLRYVTARLTERLQVKLTERERIARMLHDTILQAVQALMLRLGAVALGLPAGRLRQELEAMLRDARRTIGEGRDQVHELRAADTPTLEQTIRSCSAGLQAQYPAIALELDLATTQRALHPAVTEEAGSIACEALRNAYAHARAGCIAVRACAAPDAFVLTVADDGAGLDADVARTGTRSGHWGLVGMRERAARIGARLDIDSAARGGTTLTLTVPAAHAYADRAA